MNVFQSSEIRWFYQQSQRDIDTIGSWFVNIPGAIVEKQSTRIDGVNSWVCIPNHFAQWYTRLMNTPTKKMTVSIIDGKP